ncbi:hypothetical protein ACTXT7_016665 [Hymenolepis weldensis]
MTINLSTRLEISSPKRLWDGDSAMPDYDKQLNTADILDSNRKLKLYIRNKVNNAWSQVS